MADAASLPDGLKGKPYVIKERLYPANWFGLGLREVEELIFEWVAPSAVQTKNVGHGMAPLRSTITEYKIIWRGFSREARRERVRTLESGLMPGAVAREIVRDEAPDFPRPDYTAGGPIGELPGQAEDLAP